MHRKREDEKVLPALPRRRGFYLCARETFLLNNILAKLYIYITFLCVCELPFR